MPENVSPEKLPEIQVSALSSDTKANLSKPPPSQLPLPDDPEEKRKRAIKMTLEQFHYISFKHSNKYGDYFNCPEICPVCNKEHEMIIYKVSGAMENILEKKLIVLIVGERNPNSNCERLNNHISNTA